MFAVVDLLSVTGCLPLVVNLLSETCLPLVVNLRSVTGCLPLVVDLTGCCLHRFAPQAVSIDPFFGFGFHSLADATTPSSSACSLPLGHIQNRQ